MTKKGEALLGGGKKYLGSPLMSDLAQNQGSSLIGVIGPRGQGWYYLIAGDKGRPEEGGHSLLGSSCEGG